MLTRSRLLWAYPVHAQTSQSIYFMTSILKSVWLALACVFMMSSHCFAALPKWVKYEIVRQTYYFGPQKVQLSTTFKLTNLSSQYIITGFKTFKMTYKDMRLLPMGNAKSPIYFPTRDYTRNVPAETKKYFELRRGQSRVFNVTTNLYNFCPKTHPHMQMKLRDGAKSVHKVMMRTIPTLVIEYNKL